MGGWEGEEEACQYSHKGGGRGRVQSHGWEGEEEACRYSHKGGRERKRLVSTVTRVGGRGRGVSVQSQRWEGEEEACEDSHEISAPC